MTRNNSADKNGLFEKGTQPSSVHLTEPSGNFCFCRKPKAARVIIYHRVRRRSTHTHTTISYRSPYLLSVPGFFLNNLLNIKHKGSI